MIDITFIRENPNNFKKFMSLRNVDISVDDILSLDKNKRKKTSELQELQTQRNTFSKLIGENKRNNKDTKELEIKVSNFKNQIVQIEKELNKITIDLETILLGLPNLPEKGIPEGQDDKSNKVISMKFSKTTFNFKPLSHDILGKSNLMMDFETGSIISGSRFVVLRSDLALLERALINFMLELHVKEHGYVEISAPHLVKKESLIGTGQLPKFEKDLFKVSNDKWLIPTAEVTLTNLYRGKNFKEEELPIRLVSFSNCFRSEAGAAGTDTKGMIRLHEFKKVELVSFVRAQDSNAELERLLSCASKVLDLLKLPYRVVLLSSGDMGFSASKTYDIEVWIPSQNEYREISSCSNCKDFQSRRMKTRFKNSEGNNTFLHTLNGSGLAVGRTLLAIMENYQLNENTIKVPEVLEKYMYGKKEICIKDEKKR